MAGIETPDAEYFKKEKPEDDTKTEDDSEQNTGTPEPWELQKKEENTKDRLPSNGSREMIAEREERAASLARENSVKEGKARENDVLALEAGFEDAFPDFRRDRTASSESPENSARQTEVGRGEWEWSV